MDTKNLEDALERCFISQDAAEQFADSGNLVDVVQQLAINASKIANAITPLDAMPAPDATGDGLVSSLTEAVMGMTNGLLQIANAITDLADAVRTRSD